MKKQNFISASAVLIVSVMISKAAGALFRVPLAGLLGGTGMACFSGAYGIFLPVYAVFVSGFTAAAAKASAEKTALYGQKGAEKVKRCAVVLAASAGAAGTALMIFLAVPFSVYTSGSDRLALSVILIAPSVFFSCISAAYRGCAEGRFDMYPTAVSQVTESIARLVLGIWICTAVTENAGWFAGRFYCICTDVSALAAAGACAGVMLSVLAGMIYIMADDVFRKKPVYEEFTAECRESSREIMSELIKTAVPVAAGALLSSMTSFIDLCTIIRCIGKSISENTGYFLRKYEYVFSSGIKPEEFSEFAYGSFTGMALTVFNLVPSFTNMFGKSIFPAAADAWVRGDTEGVRKNTETVLKITAAAAVPAGCGMFVMADEILAFLFPSSAAENMFCADALRYLGISVIFLCISYPVFSLLQATGNAGTAAWIMLAGSAVKSAGNMMLVRIPELNISGAAVSTGISYAVILFLSLRALAVHTGIRTGLLRLFSGPVYSSLLCAAAAQTVKTCPLIPENRTLILFLAVGAGAVVYAASMYLLGEYKFFKQMKDNVESQGNTD